MRGRQRALTRGKCRSESRSAGRAPAAGRRRRPGPDGPPQPRPRPRRRAPRSTPLVRTQPAVDCSEGSGYSAFWVGLDGYSSTVEQTGTEADCSGGSASYYAWYEAYPAASNTYGDTVDAGDSLTATVTESSGDVFDLVLTDSTQGWTESTDVTVSGAELSSAEVIAEAPSDNSGILPLADFGTVNFTNAEANDTGFDPLSPEQIDMESSSGSLEATTSALSDDDFSVTWDSSGSSGGTRHHG